MKLCGEESCLYSNDDGALYCAKCGRRLTIGQPRSFPLLGMKKIASAAEGGGIELRLPDGELNDGRPIHWGRCAGRTYLFIHDKSCRVFQFDGEFGQAVGLTPLPAAWPHAEEWIRPPAYSPLAVAAISPRRLTWARTRRLLGQEPPETIQTIELTENNEKFLGLGLADDVWLLCARFLANGDLAIEAGTGENQRLLRIATLRGPIDPDEAVFIGAAPWLAGADTGGDMEADTPFVLASESFASRLPMRHLWLIVGSHVLVADLAADQITTCLRVGTRGLPLTFWDRQTSSLIEPLALSGRVSGLYASYFGSEGPDHGFLAARSPLRMSPLGVPAGIPRDERRKSHIVAANDGTSALLVSPQAITPYVGAQPQDPQINHFNKEFEPLAAPGFVACFAEPGFGSDHGKSRLNIYRYSEANLSIHAELALDMPLESALPPLFTGDRLQLLGHSDGHLSTMILPIVRVTAS